MLDGTESFCKQAQIDKKTKDMDDYQWMNYNVY